MDKQSQPFSFDAIKRSAENLGILAKKTVEKAVPYLDPTNPFYDKIPVLKQTRELSRSLGYDPAMDNSIPFKERLPMYLQKYGEGFMGSHGGLGKAPSKGILPNPIAKRAFQLANEMDAKGNISIEQTDEVMQMVKDYLKLPEKQAAKMTIPQMLQELTGNADNDQMAAFYKVPQRSKQPNVAKQSFYDTKPWYHGSQQPIEQLDFNRKASKGNELPYGIHFTQDKQIASDFATGTTKGMPTGKQGVVNEVDLIVKNPFDTRKIVYKPDDQQYNILKEIAEKSGIKNAERPYNRSLGFLASSGSLQDTIAIDAKHVLDQAKPSVVKEVLKKHGFDPVIQYKMRGTLDPLGGGAPVYTDAIAVLDKSAVRSRVAQESLGDIKDFDIPNLGQSILNVLNKNK